MENALTANSNKYLIGTADINTFSHRILTINIMQFRNPLLLRENFDNFLIDAIVAKERGVIR